jgi:sulfite reductase alpha subunit-like flavoprotein
MENNNSGSIEERRLTVLYATQTGTAEEVAERISREAKRRHFQVQLSSLEVFPKV